MNTKDKTFKLKDGRRLSYVEYGDPKGKPLFFFHGWPGSRYSGKETDDVAKKIGVRIISPDRPGMGLSDFQDNRKLLDWADDIVELGNYLQIKKFSILGVSGGGPYVVACAYKIPERLTKAGIVVGLAPINVKGNLHGMDWQGRLGWPNYHWWVVRTVATIGASLYFRYFPYLGLKFAFSTKEDRKLLHEIRKATGKENGTYEAFKQGLKGPKEELKIYVSDWGFNLINIKTKVFLWYGAKDRSVSVNMGKYYHSQIQNSKLFIKKDWAHLTRYKHEKEILKTLTE